MNLNDLNEDQKAVYDNFLDLEQDLIDSEKKEDLSILREAWNVEISKPGCTNCIKNGAKHKYSQLCFNMIANDLTIEQSKSIFDKRMELNKRHGDVAKQIEDEIQAEIDSLKNS